MTDDIHDALERIITGLGRKFENPMTPEVIAVSIMGIYGRIAYQYLLWQNRSEDILAIGRDAVALIIDGVTGLVGDD